MYITEADQMLDAFYLPFESGWKRLGTGVINNAVRTPMVGCTPAMVDWWLGSCTIARSFAGDIHGTTSGAPGREIPRRACTWGGPI